MVEVIGHPDFGPRRWSPIEAVGQLMHWAFGFEFGLNKLNDKVSAKAELEEMAPTV